jgi:hypothetical protein
MKNLLFSLILSCSLVSTAISMEPKQFIPAVTKYSQCLALGAITTYLHNEGHANASMGAGTLSIIFAGFSIFNVVRDDFISKSIATILGGLAIQKYMEKNKN